MKIAQNRRTTGFTLLELMAVVVLIGILASILLPRASAARDKAAQNACYHNRTLLNSAVERYEVLTGAAPTDLNDLNVPEYFPDGIPVCPVSGNPYTLNAGTQRVIGHAGGVHP